MTRLAEGKPIGNSKKFVATLDDDRAMDLAGKFVSEGFVLAVSDHMLYTAICTLRWPIVDVSQWYYIRVREPS